MQYIRLYAESIKERTANSDAGPLHFSLFRRRLLKSWSTYSSNQQWSSTCQRHLKPWPLPTSAAPAARMPSWQQEVLWRRYAGAAMRRPSHHQISWFFSTTSPPTTSTSCSEACRIWSRIATRRKDAVRQCSLLVSLGASMEDCFQKQACTS